MLKVKLLLKLTSNICCNAEPWIKVARKIGMTINDFTLLDMLLEIKSATKSEKMTIKNRYNFVTARISNPIKRIESHFKLNLLSPSSESLEKARAITPEVKYRRGSLSPSELQMIVVGMKTINAK